MCNFGIDESKNVEGAKEKVYTILDAKRGSVTRRVYIRFAVLPWPLSPRQVMMKAVHILQNKGEHKKAPRYVLLHHDVLPNIKTKPGYVRGNFKFSPLVCLENPTNGECQVTAFANLNLGGSFPFMLQSVAADGALAL